MENIKSHFLLNKEICFLNNGSFGACPSPIFKSYQNYQKEIENEPIQFFTKKGPQYLAQSKVSFANYFNCHSEDFFFTSNPTTAINTIVKSLCLNSDDEVLATNLEYGAVDKTWQFYSKKNSFKYIQQNISLPIKDQDSFVTEFFKGVNSKTKVISICHITSSTALILPIKAIIAKAKRLGIICIIDGAHVPGHIPLNLRELDADFYVGALHKWFLAPKGLSFLYVSKKMQSLLEPLIVSWGYESDNPSQSRFLDWHEYNGTRDYSAYLCVPEIVKFRKHHNWETLIEQSKSLILKWYPKFCALMKSEAICPLNKDFLGQMCSVPINTTSPLELKEELYQKYKIEIPITNLGKQYFIRISIQPYNTATDLEYLYKSLKSIVDEGILIKA